MLPDAPTMPEGPIWDGNDNNDEGYDNNDDSGEDKGYDITNDDSGEDDGEDKWQWRKSPSQCRRPRQGWLGRTLDSDYQPAAVSRYSGATSAPTFFYTNCNG